MPGERGHKDRETDLKEAIDAIQRAIVLLGNKGVLSRIEGPETKTPAD